MTSSGKGSEGIRMLLPPGIWGLDPDRYTGMKRHLLITYQTATLIFRDFWNDQCLLRASALTFTTILSIVPLFALIFAVLKGFGIQNRLEPFILGQVAAGSQEIVSRIVSYINNTNMGSLGAIGFAALIVTVISLFGSIEEAFNAIWGVREDRPLSRKFSDYLSVMISAPLLLLAAVSITTSLGNQSVVRWLMDREYIGDLLPYCIHLVPYVSIWVALVFLYIFIPNTRVRFTSALLGGVIAGTIWQIAQWGYLSFQIGVARYNAIYGTLSLLPVFMIWIYTSWLIVLFGVEVVYAHQNRRTIRQECHGLPVSQAAREEIALALLVECAAAFQRSETPPTAERLAAGLDIPDRQVKELLDELERLGFLARRAGNDPVWQPSRDPALLTVREVLELLRQSGNSFVMSQTTRSEELVRRVLVQAASGMDKALEGVTVGDLVTYLDTAP